MDIHEYIESGILELYVYGVLSSEEAGEVGKKLREHPEIRDEVEQIEKALQHLGIAAAPYNPEKLMAAIRKKLQNTAEPVPVVEVEPKRRRNWPAYTGWAASLVLLIGLFVLLNKNNSLRDELEAASAENAQMEQQIADARESAEKTEVLLGLYRDRELQKVELAGQAAAPGSFATVIWDEQENKAYIDALGLPEPPPGKVYQVWSLTLNPLKPTSIGLLHDFEADKNKIFTLPNPNESQAFGITLEPEGGSKTPTMEQLYVLGVVEAES